MEVKPKTALVVVLVWMVISTVGIAIWTDDRFAADIAKWLVAHTSK